MRIDRTNEPVARRIHKRGLKKKVHYLAPAGGRLAEYESRLEASAGVAFGLDPRVSKARTQPMTFDLATGRQFSSKDSLYEWARESGSRPIPYTPDFELEMCSGRVLVEVKHSALIDRDPKILSYPSVLARYGFRLIILDDRILHDTFVRNLRALSLARSYAPSRSEAETAQEICQSWISLRALRSLGYSDPLILGCIAYGHLTCDIQRERISSNTLIRASEGAPTHLMELPLDASLSS